MIDRVFVPGLRGQFGADMLFAELDDVVAGDRVRVIVGGPTTSIIAQHLAGFWGSLIEVEEPHDVRAELRRMGRELHRHLRPLTFRARPVAPVRPAGPGRPVGGRSGRGGRRWSGPRSWVAGIVGGAVVGAAVVGAGVVGSGAGRGGGRRRRGDGD